MEAYSFRYTKGDNYKHSKLIPHRIDFIDGTITVLTKENIHPNSLAYSYVKDSGEWVSAAPRIATDEEVMTFISAANKLKES